MSIEIGSEVSPVKRLADGGILFKEGEKAEFIYVIQEGQFVGIKERDKRLVPVLLASDKGVLGIEALTNDGKYLYSAIAKSRSVAVPIPIEDIKAFFSEAPQLMGELIDTLVHKVIATTDMLSEHRIIEESLYVNGNFEEDEPKNLKALKN